MPRQMTSAMQAWLAGSELPIALFFEGTFASGVVRLWTGRGPITWNAQTWQGVGSLGQISPIGEGATVEARGIAVSLSGFDPALLSDVLAEFQLGVPAYVYVAGFNAGALIADPILSFAGRMDLPTVQTDGKTGSITINLESRLLEMNVAVDRRYTADDQQRDWPGDLGFNFVNLIQEMTLYWGQTPTSAANI